MEMRKWEQIIRIYLAKLLARYWFWGRRWQQTYRRWRADRLYFWHQERQKRGVVSTVNCQRLFEPSGTSQPLSWWQKLLGWRVRPSYQSMSTINNSSQSHQQVVYQAPIVIETVPRPINKRPLWVWPRRHGFKKKRVIREKWRLILIWHHHQQHKKSHIKYPSWRRIARYQKRRESIVLRRTLSRGVQLFWVTFSFGRARVRRGRVPARDLPLRDG